MAGDGLTPGMARESPRQLQTGAENEECGYSKSKAKLPPSLSQDTQGKHTMVSLQIVIFGCFLLCEFSPELMLTHSTVMSRAKWFHSSVKQHFARKTISFALNGALFGFTQHSPASSSSSQLLPVHSLQAIIYSLSLCHRMGNGSTFYCLSQTDEDSLKALPSLVQKLLYLGLVTPFVAPHSLALS